MRTAIIKPEPARLPVPPDRSGECCVGFNADRVGVYFWRHRAAAEGNPWGGRRKLKGKVVLVVELPEPFTQLLRRDWEFFEDETEAWIYPADVPPAWIKT